MKQNLNYSKDFRGFSQADGQYIFFLLNSDSNIVIYNLYDYSNKCM